MPRTTGFLLSRRTITAQKRLMILRTSSAAGRDACTLGERDKLRHASNLQLLHRLLPVSLDRALRPAQSAGDMLVGVADNDKVEDLPLARCQRCEPSVDNIQFGLLLPRCLVVYERPFNGRKQVLG